MSPELHIAYKGFDRVVHECITDEPYPGPREGVKPLSKLVTRLVMETARQNPRLRAEVVVLFEGFAFEDCPEGVDALRAQVAAEANKSLAKSIVSEIGFES